MKLKEKFRNVFKKHFNKGKEEELLLELVDDDLEKVADDYAIEFAEWLSFNDLFYSKLKFLDYKELLEIFKKEKRV